MGREQLVRYGAITLASLVALTMVGCGSAPARGALGPVATPAATIEAKSTPTLDEQIESLMTPDIASLQKELEQLFKTDITRNVIFTVGQDGTVKDQTLVLYIQTKNDRNTQNIQNILQNAEVATWTMEEKYAAYRHLFNIAYGKDLIDAGWGWAHPEEKKTAQEILESGKMPEYYPVGIVTNRSDTLVQDTASALEEEHIFAVVVPPEAIRLAAQEPDKLWDGSEGVKLSWGDQKQRVIIGIMPKNGQPIELKSSRSFNLSGVNGTYPVQEYYIVDASQRMGLN